MHYHRSLLLAVVLLLLPLSINAQDRVREAREVASFTEVGFSIPGTLHIRQGDTQSVEVEAAEKVLDHVETTVDDDRLEIKDDASFFERMFDGRDWGEIDVYVTMPRIETLSLAGSGTIRGETPIESSALALENAGAGELDLEVATTDLRTSIAGSGTVRLRGTTNSVNIQIAGSGTIHASDLTASAAEVTVAGSGDIHLHVTDQLSAEIMGSGDVVYRGSPTIETSILGSGEVRSEE